MTYIRMAFRNQLISIVPALLALFALIGGTPVLAGQLAISSLPHTVDQTSHSAALWDTITIAGTKLVSTTDGIKFNSNCHNWLILLDRDTIIFGTDSTYHPSVYAGARGIDLGYGSHDMIIKGGYILHQPDNVTGNETVYNPNDDVNDYNLCIRAGGTYNILVDSVREARIRGVNSHVMSSGRMTTVRNSRLFNDCYAYDSRELFMATCITIGGSASELLSGEYHCRILNSYLEDNAHAAVFGIANSSSTYIVVQLDGDTIKVDSRNLKYLAYDGTGHSNTNAYAVQFTYGGPGSYIKNCVITSGTRYSGGRGIQLARSFGTQTNPVEIAYNKISCHEGLNVEFGTLYYGCAVKIRQHCAGVWLHHNAITWTADTTQTVGRAYQPKGEALMYQMGFDAGGAFGGPYYITIENNACSTKVLTNVNDPDYELSTVDFETCEYSDNTVIYRNNKMYSSGNHAYNFGQYDGGGSHLRMSGDTVIINQSSAVNPKWTFNPGDYRGAIDNWATDFAYSPSTADTSITHEFQNNTTAAGSQNITLRKTISVYVKGNNGSPVVNATVTVRNAYNQTVVSGVTNNGGRLSGTVSYWYETRTGSDSTGFNNFTTAAASGTDNASHSFAVRWNSTNDTLTLSQTAGTGTWETGGGDVTPPNQIQDLGIVPGGPKTSVTLRWTAIGDDGYVGTAASYDLRRSNLPITVGNFAGATAISGEPAPKPSGSIETFTVSALDSTTTYYFAIKAADDVTNWSDMSNVVVRNPSGDQTSPAAISNLLASTGSAQGEINLSWTTPGDDGAIGIADHYIVKYSTQAISGANWGTATMALAPPAPLAANSPQSMTLGGLTPGVFYYAGVVTVDEVGNQSDLSNIASAQSKIIIITGDDSGTVTIVEPTDYAVIPDVQPSLVVLNIDTAPTNVYQFEVATDSAFSNVVASSGDIAQQAGIQTSWRVASPLQTHSDYYWHVKANGGAYSGFAAFTVDVETKAYPNPFRLAEGNQVTFTGIPSGSNLLLMTSSGDTVRRWVNTDGSSIIWNGKNESDQQVATGIYLWYVEASDIKGKLIVIR